MTGRFTIIDHYGKIRAKLSNCMLYLALSVEQGTQGLHFCRVEPLVDDPIISDDLEIITGYKNIASRILL